MPLLILVVLLTVVIQKLVAEQLIIVFMILVGNGELVDHLAFVAQILIAPQDKCVILQLIDVHHVKLKAKAAQVGHNVALTILQEIFAIILQLAVMANAVLVVVV